MSLDKTLLTLTALRDGLKILWKPAAFWITKDRVSQALMKRLDAVRVAFHRSPRKSIRVASNKLAIPRSIVYKVLHKRLRLHAYNLQIVQALKPDDHPRRAAFAEENLKRIDDDNDYLNSVIFSDKATFYVSGKVNKHNIQIWELENPCEVVKKKETVPKSMFGVI